jgi:aminoglycoside phosphotransferase (APT) family kinase protein
MTHSRAVDGITDAMLHWVAGAVEGLGHVESVHLIAGGRSNLTFLLTGSCGRQCVLRRPPLGEILESAHDMGREWRFLTALHGTAIPVATPLAFCDDRALCDRDFYVMEHVDGVVLGDKSDAVTLSPEARHRAGESLADVLSELHQIDAHTTGATLTSRATDGYVGRQVDRWTRQMAGLDFPEKALLLEAGTLLGTSVPPQRTGIVHGDYRPGNLSFAATGEVIGVFDWELATVGDVMVDLGWLVASWQNPGDDDGFLPTTESPTGVPGFLTRDEIAGRYGARTGHDVSDLDWYVAFSRWRMACIAAGVRHRYAAGVMGDDGFSTRDMGELIRGLGERALLAVS